MLLKKKVEELEQQLAQRVEELEHKVNVTFILKVPPQDFSITSP